MSGQRSAASGRRSVAIQAGAPSMSTRWARPCCCEALRRRAASAAWRAASPAASISRKASGQGDEREQQVVEFVLVADVGPELVADGVDGGLVEAACAFGDGVGQGAGAVVTARVRRAAASSSSRKA